LYSSWDYGVRQPLVSMMLQEIKDLMVTALGLSLGIQMSTRSLMRSSLNVGLTTKVA
jgi:hypothetical protein